MIKIVTHSGSFHSDEIFAIATLSLLLENEKLDIIRTRDPKIISTGDYVVDVGGVLDVNLKRFDHHQSGGAGKRENGIPYASFGLVWKTFGEKICGSYEVADEIDKKLVQPVDAIDVGMDLVQPIIPDIYPYSIQRIISAFSPTWKEEENVDEFSIFIELVSLAKKILEREVAWGKDLIEGKKIVESIFEKSVDKQIITMDKEYPWFASLISHPEPLYVIYPHSADNTWHVRAIPAGMNTFENRKSFPEEWAGKMNQDLATTSGVADATFCHNARFLAVAKSLDGAVALAKLALLLV